MRVFVTGATGFIGSLVVKDLIAAGHQVIGVYRSDDKAPALAAAGAEAYRGSIDDPDSLKDGAARSDGVIHLAFNHDFSKFAANCETDRRVIEALGSVLAGSDRPLIVTSGTAIAKVAPGEPATEDAPRISSNDFPRAASEEATADVAADGVNTSVVRLPQVHDPERQGLISPGSRPLGKRASSPMSERGVTAGPRRTFPMSPASTGWRSKRRSEDAVYNAVAEEGVRGARHRGNHRSTPEAAGQVHRAGGGARLFRLACPSGRARHACLKRADAEEARMAADRARADRRPRTIAGPLRAEAGYPPGSITALLAGASCGARGQRRRRGALFCLFERRRRDDAHLRFVARLSGRALRRGRRGWRSVVGFGRMRCDTGLA